jgi:hypothetical protein
MRLNVHLHVLALDGVYVRDLAALVFHPLPTPEAEGVGAKSKRSWKVSGGEASAWASRERPERRNPGARRPADGMRSGSGVGALGSGGETGLCPHGGLDACRQRESIGRPGVCRRSQRG